LKSVFYILLRRTCYKYFLPEISSISFRRCSYAGARARAFYSGSVLIKINLDHLLTPGTTRALVSCSRACPMWFYDAELLLAVY